MTIRRKRCEARRGEPALLLTLARLMSLFLCIVLSGFGIGVGSTTVTTVVVVVCSYVTKTDSDALHLAQHSKAKQE